MQKNKIWVMLVAIMALSGVNPAFQNNLSFWVSASFVCCVVIFAPLIKKNLFKAIDDRRQHIQSALQHAQKDLHKAYNACEQASKDHQKIMNTVRQIQLLATQEITLMYETSEEEKRGYEVIKKHFLSAFLEHSHHKAKRTIVESLIEGATSHALDFFKKSPPLPSCTKGIMGALAKKQTSFASLLPSKRSSSARPH